MLINYTLKKCLYINNKTSFVLGIGGSCSLISSSHFFTLPNFFFISEKQNFYVYSIDLEAKQYFYLLDSLFTI